MKNKQLLIIPFLFIAIFSKAQINAPVNVPALGISPTGNDPSSIFSYQNHPTAHYGIGWYNDYEFTGAAMGYLSGYGGLKFFTAGQPKMILDVYGRLGIGTNSPETQLNINVGAGGVNGIAGLRIGGTNNYSSLEFGIDGDYDGMIRSFGNNINYYADHWKTIGSVATENHSHKWFTSKIGSADWSVTKMILNQDGNVGIGTTNPGYKLDVIGTIRSREVKVDLLGADFVFEKDYGLMPLSDLEKFITTNKHLPQIATAKEMESNGVELGSLNSKLLQKVEELTLYLIEINKKNDLQDELIKKQQLLIDKLLKTQKP